MSRLELVATELELTIYTHFAQAKAMYLLYIDAISVTKERSTQNQGRDGEVQV